MTKDEVYKLIAESSIFGNLGLFIGAGFSLAVNQESHTCTPLSWPELLKKICLENDILWDDKTEENGNIIKSEIKKEYVSCPEIASQICKIISKKNTIPLEDAIKKFKHEVCNITSWYADAQQRGIFHDLLKSISPNWIVTTNYDLIIETLLPEETFSLSPNDEFVYPKNKIPIYHLHGIRTEPETIIITREDYIELSRPHNYRMEKLSLMFSESSTIMIGYKLGDQNVQTALDWSRNVYDEQHIGKQKYPHNIIQLVYNDNPKNEPYETSNGIIILETNSVYNILQEMSETISQLQCEYDQKNITLNEYQNKYLNSTQSDIDFFIGDENKRKQMLDEIIEYPEIVIATESFLSEVFKYLWKQTEDFGHFDEYADILNILLYIFNNYELTKFPPSIYMFIIGQFDKLALYINDTIGSSFKAYNIWLSEKDSVLDNNKNEIRNISQWNWRIKSLLFRADFN